MRILRIQGFSESCLGFNEHTKCLMVHYALPTIVLFEVNVIFIVHFIFIIIVILVIIVVFLIWAFIIFILIQRWSPLAPPTAIRLGPLAILQKVLRVRSTGTNHFPITIQSDAHWVRSWSCRWESTGSSLLL